MSTSVLPSLAGLGFDVIREPMWNSNVQEAISGKEVRLAYWTYPKYKWSVMYNILRSSATSAELQQLMAFFNARQGQMDTFLYQDADDYSTLINNSGSYQAIATGDGTTTLFQLVKSFGGYVEPVLAPNTSGTINVYLGGTLQSGATYTINGWGTANPGTISFNTAPTNGTAIAASFTYYYPCRMSADSISFKMFLTQFYNLGKLTFQSVKN